MKLLLSFRNFCVLTPFWFIIATNTIFAAQFTVDDIIDGIEARRSKIRDVAISYTVTDENTDRFYEKRVRKVTDPATGELVDSVPIWKSIDEVQTQKFDIFERGNNVAYKVYESNIADNSWAILEQAVFDGEIQKYVNHKILNGIVERRKPETFINFRTMPIFLGIERMDIVDYVKRPEIECRIIDEKKLNDDLIVELSIIRRTDPKTPDPSGIGFLPREQVTEHVVQIAVDKDFWPVKIEKYREMNDLKTGDKRRVLIESVNTGGFTKCNGVYYPTSIEQKEFDYDTQKVDDQSMPVVTRDQILTTSSKIIINKAEINSGLSDDVFDFEFPHGARILDDLAGMLMVIGEDPEKLAEIMERSIDALPTEDFTEEEATAILQLRRAGKWEEGEKLKEEILHGKKGGPIPENKTDVKAIQQTLSVPEKKIPLTIKQEVQATENRDWHKFIIYILLGVGCVSVSYIVTKYLRRMRVCQQ